MLSNGLGGCSRAANPQCGSNSGYAPCTHIGQRSCVAYKSINNESPLASDLGAVVLAFILVSRKST